MNDGELFLKAVRENPEDDHLRLIYADWLDEHDDPEWAAYIRLVLSPTKANVNVRRGATVKMNRRFQKQFLTTDYSRVVYIGLVKGFVERVVLPVSALPAVVSLVKAHPVRWISAYSRRTFYRGGQWYVGFDPDTNPPEGLPTLYPFNIQDMPDDVGLTTPALVEWCRKQP
jgi:uncharacterized protein (TIGR02996 family)